MKNKVKQEIISICKSRKLDCNISSKDSLQKIKEKFKNKVSWDYISQHQKLSEDFIREFKDNVNWNWISIYQKLSEDFIREFKDYVGWGYISQHQKLSEDFIKKFKNKLIFNNICISHKLSEDFIREFQNELGWGLISKYQRLSEEFIREFKDKVNWPYISRYQKLSKDFIREFNLTIPETCALYTSNEDKLKYIKENTSYKVIDDKYLFAYKAVKDDMRSVYLPNHYLYEVGKEYESNCDCNIEDENSFGLSAWAKDGALCYYPSGKLLKVRINIEDLGCIVHGANKIRCRKLTVLSIEK